MKILTAPDAGFPIMKKWLPLVLGVWSWPRLCSTSAARFCSASLLGLALAVTSATVCTAQLVRTEEISVGKISDLYETGSIEITVKIPHGAGSREKALAIRVVDSLNEYTTSIDIFSPREVALVITNLQEMVDESAKSPDYLEYPLPEKNSR